MFKQTRAGGYISSAHAINSAFCTHLSSVQGAAGLKIRHLKLFDSTDRFQFHKLTMEATIGTDATTATGDQLAVRPPHDVRGVHWVPGKDGSWTAFTTPSFVSSSSLKRMLDSRYAGRYSVEVRNELNETI